MFQLFRVVSWEQWKAKFIIPKSILVNSLPLPLWISRSHFVQNLPAFQATFSKLTVGVLTLTVLPFFISLLCCILLAFCFVITLVSFISTNICSAGTLMLWKETRNNILNADSSLAEWKNRNQIKMIPSLFLLFSSSLPTQWLRFPPHLNTLEEIDTPPKISLSCFFLLKSTTYWIIWAFKHPLYFSRAI